MSQLTQKQIARMTHELGIYRAELRKIADHKVDMWEDGIDVYYELKAIAREALGKGKQIKERAGKVDKCV